MLQGVLNICTKTESQAWKGFNSSFVHIFKKKNDTETKKSEKGNTIVKSL